MKKYILIFITILLIPINVIAGGSSDDSASAAMIRQTCIYESPSLIDSRRGEKIRYNYNKFDFSNISESAGGPNVQIKSYYNVDLGEDTVVFETEPSSDKTYIINHNKDYGTHFDIADFMHNQFDKYKENEEKLQKAIDDGVFCPSNVYEITKDDKREYMFCNGYDDELEEDTCSLVEKYISKKYSGYSVKEQELVADIAISNNGQDDTSKTDVKDKYVEIEKEKESACDNSSVSYNLEECKNLGELSDTIVDQAADQGIDEKTLYEYKEAQLTPIKPDIETCDSILGSTSCENGQDCDPAFYIQTIFNVMKYVAIILLIVMSSLDFFGAVGSNDDGAMKKAMNKCITRLILCLLIFFIPTILEYIFTWMNVYNPSTCGIK